MEHGHSKTYFWLFVFSYIAVAVFQIGWSGKSGAAVTGSDDTGAGSTTSQLVDVDTGDGFVVDGYQSIKFGMDVIELKNMGYKCPNDSKTKCEF